MDSRQMSSNDGVGDREPIHIEPLLVNAKQAAALCGKSLRTWRTWDALGLIPRPVRIKRSTLWRLNELTAWISARCPRREDWEARR
jgi:predicted DNA-binding transcriptional regulator AlpA